MSKIDSARRGQKFYTDDVFSCESQQHYLTYEITLEMRFIPHQIVIYYSLQSSAKCDATTMSQSRIMEFDIHDVYVLILLNKRYNSVGLGVNQSPSPAVKRKTTPLKSYCSQATEC